MSINLFIFMTTLLMLPVVWSNPKCKVEIWNSEFPKSEAEFNKQIKTMNRKTLVSLAIGESLKEEGKNSLSPALWLYLANTENEIKVRKLYFKQCFQDLKRMRPIARDPMIEADADKVEIIWNRKLFFTSKSLKSKSQLCDEFGDIK